MVLQIPRLALERRTYLGYVLWLPAPPNVSTQIKETTDRLPFWRHQKFNKLHGPAEDFSLLNCSKTLVLLSSNPVDSTMLLVWERGLHFASAPWTSPIKDICGVELAIWELPLAEAEEIREQTCQILKTALSPKLNVTAVERRALQELRKDKELAILKPD